MRFAVLLFAIPMAACLGPAPPPPPIPAELAGATNCAETVFPEDPMVDPATVDRFTGIYRRGRESVSVTRQAQRFMVHRVRYGVREIRGETPASRRFRDACGVTYDFQLPGDGPGAWLTISDRDGTVTRWHRQGY